jgi:hypothetical protein
MKYYFLLKIRNNFNLLHVIFNLWYMKIKN